MSALAFPPPNVTINQGQTGSGGFLLRQEVWGPTEYLTNDTRHLFRMPVEVAWDEVVFDAAILGTVNVQVQILAEGIGLFPGPIDLGAVLRVPKSFWNITSGVILRGTHLQVEVTVDGMTEYDTPWAGLGVTFVKS